MKPLPLVCTMRRDKVLAIDFDGTIYDKKTKSMIDGSEDAIKELKERGYILVLWTCRTGNRLSNAENILKKHGLMNCFYCINETPDFVKYKTSCKVCAKWYIDDRNVGGFIGWNKILEILK